MPRAHPPYKAETVANSFIKRAQDEGGGVTPMKVLKLVYFAQGWHLALTDKRLIKDPVEAWEYGPVIPSLYHALKGYGDRHIRMFLRTGDDPVTVPEEDIHTQALLDAVWRAYGRYDALKLSDITHMPGTPWYDVVHTEYGGHVPRGIDIDTERIKKYFRELGGVAEEASSSKASASDPMAHA